MEQVANIPLNAPLNLAFVNKKDPQARFIANNGLLTEAGLHNAYEQHGDGVYLGDFDEQAVRDMVPVTKVLQFEYHKKESGLFLYLNPTVTATWPNNANDPVRLSNGNNINIPENLRRLEWRPSSGVGNQFMAACMFDGVRMVIHTFHVLANGLPIFRQTLVPISTYTNPNTAPLSNIRMAQGEMGSVTLQSYLSSLSNIRVHPVTFDHITGDEGSQVTERYLMVGLDLQSFSLNSCAVMRLNADGSARNVRVVKGFFMPSFNGMIRGFPFPANHVDAQRGYVPFLRGANDAFIPLNVETVRADIHRGVVFDSNMLHHLPDTSRTSAVLNDTQTTERLICGLLFGGFEFMPFSNSQNINNEFYVELSESALRHAGITAMFNGFVFERRPLRLTNDDTDWDLPNFGGFYTVPLRHVGARFADFGIAQYSMVGVFEARHQSFASNADPFMAIGEGWPATLTRAEGSRFSVRHYRSIGHFGQERNIRNRSWTIEQSRPVLRQTSGNNSSRTANFEAIGPGTAVIQHRSEQQHGGSWRWHVQRLTVTVTPLIDGTMTTGEARLIFDLGRAVLNYPAKESVAVEQTSYGLDAWEQPGEGQLHQGVFHLMPFSSTTNIFANVLYSGDTNIPSRANTSASMELKPSPQGLGIFDAGILSIPEIDLSITTGLGESLWTSINDTKVATGAPNQIIIWENALLLVFDDFNVHVHSTNGGGAMLPEVKLLTPHIVAITQTGANIVEMTDRLRAHHAFSGLGFMTNVVGASHSPGIDEIQSNFQDILVDNRHGNVLPPNSLSLPDGFLAITPDYPQPVQHVNANTPPSQIRDNINAFRYAIPVSARHGPNLDQWMLVQGNNVIVHVIDGRFTLTSDIIGSRTNLRQIVILGQLFEFDRNFISAVTIESGQRIFGTPINIFNKKFAGSTSQRAYFFDVVSKSVDMFSLDSGFDTGVPLDLLDDVIDAVPLNEFSYTLVDRLDELGNVTRTLLHMADSGVFFRDFSHLEINDGDTLSVGIGGLLIQNENGWRILRNVLLSSEIDRLNNGDGFSFAPLRFQTAFAGLEGRFIIPRFWELDIYLSAAMRKLWRGRENEPITVRMKSKSIHDRKLWEDGWRVFTFKIRDFKDGYYTVRYDCRPEECASQSLLLEANDYIHISQIAFKYVEGAVPTDR